jgi:uncharacterized protein YkwD
MVRNTCPNCGVVTDDPSQKFCTRCGTKLPDLPAAAAATPGIPAWAIAGTGIVIVLLLAVVLWPMLVPVISGTSSTGPAGAGTVNPIMTPADITPVPTTPTSTSTPPSQTVVTTPPTPVPTTILPVKAITTMPATTIPVTKTTPPTTVVTVIPTPEFTAQITLSVTQIPVQPPVSTLTSKTPGAPYIDPAALEARIHELINVQRQQNGLSTISYDPFLADIARGHSYDMVLRNFFEHENPDGKNARGRGEAAGYPCVRDFGTYFTSGISENLYQGYRYHSYLTAPNGTIMAYNWSSVDYIANQAVNGWMNSQGHRENILDYHFQQEGIGVSFSSDDKIYVTENFC